MVWIRHEATFPLRGPNVTKRSKGEKSGVMSETDVERSSESFVVRSEERLWL